MARRKTVSPEEQRRQSLERQLRDLRENFIPEPPSHIRYQVGDRVQHGSIDKSIVTAVHDDWKIYLLHEDNIENHYGKKIPTERDMYISWVDISPWRSPEEMASIPKFSERDLTRLNFCQMELDSILHMNYHFGIDMEPDYQRGNVWSLDDKVKLIASVFLNVDIGKFVFISLPFKHLAPAYEVLDGKQRVIALTEFFEGRFTFQGKTFQQLHRGDQRHFEGHAVSIAKIGNEDIKLSDKYRYFLRLNTGGKPQDPKHLEMVEKLYKEALKKGL